MQKTRKCIAKKFKVTGSGRVLRRSPGFRHQLRNKTAQQKRRAQKDKSIGSGYAKTVKAAISPGL